MINEQTYSPTTERYAPMLLRKCTAMMKSKTVTLSSIRNVINKTATSNGRNKLNSNVAMSREIFHHLLKMMWRKKEERM